MNKNTNDEKSRKSLLSFSRLFFFSFLFFGAFFNSQIILSGQVDIYGKEHIFLHNTDSLIVENQESKIYITGGAVIITDAENSNHDLKIATAKYFESSEYVTTSPDSVSKKKIAEERRIHLKTEKSPRHEFYYSKSKKNNDYASNTNSPQLIFLTGSNSVENIINAECKEFTVSFFSSHIKRQYFKRENFFCSQNRSYFSVRPPPVCFI